MSAEIEQRKLAAIMFTDMVSYSALSQRNGKRGLREKDKAMDWLEKAYEEGSIWLGWLKVDPVYDPLRSNPRFLVLYKKLNFPP
jgi:hypothetical protein